MPMKFITSMNEYGNMMGLRCCSNFVDKEILTSSILAITEEDLFKVEGKEGVVKCPLCNYRIN